MQGWGWGSEGERGCIEWKGIEVESRWKGNGGDGIRVDRWMGDWKRRRGLGGNVED